MTRPAILAVAALALLVGCPTAPQFPEQAPADACTAGAIQTGEQVLRIDIEGKTRQALVWMPEVDGPYEIVVNLHSFRSEPRRVAHYMKLVEWARDKPIILVGADGKTATWNAGECCGKAQQRNYPDPAFLDALVERVESVACTNGKVTVSGLGNGAMMAHRWACESDVPDALLTSGGTLQQEECPRTRPLPVLHYHGDEDTFTAIDGSTGHRPVEHGLAHWRRINGTAGPVQTLESGELSCQTWRGTEPVAFCTVAGGFHGWPGAADMPVDSTHVLADPTPHGFDWLNEALAQDDAVEGGGAVPSAPDTVQPALEPSVQSEEDAH